MTGTGIFIWFLRESWPNEGKALEKTQAITDHTTSVPKTQGKFPSTFPARVWSILVRGRDTGHPHPHPKSILGYLSSPAGQVQHLKLVQVLPPSKEGIQALPPLLQHLGGF